MSRRPDDKPPRPPGVPSGVGADGKPTEDLPLNQRMRGLWQCLRTCDKFPRVLLDKMSRDAQLATEALEIMSAGLSHLARAVDNRSSHKHLEAILHAIAEELKSRHERVASLDCPECKGGRGTVEPCPGCGRQG